MGAAVRQMSSSSRPSMTGAFVARTAVAMRTTAPTPGPPAAGALAPPAGLELTTAVTACNANSTAGSIGWMPRVGSLAGGEREKTFDVQYGRDRLLVSTPAGPGWFGTRHKPVLFQRESAGHLENPPSRQCPPAPSLTPRPMTPDDARGDAATGASAETLGAGTVYTLLAALGFGAVSTLTSIAVAEHVGLWNVLTWRYVLGSVVMVAFVGTRHYPRMPSREAFRFMTVGGGGQALLVGLALSSLRYITAAKLAFLFLTYPAWVTLVQTVRGAERLSARRLFALALSFGGTVVIGTGAAAASNSAGPVLVPGLEWKGVALALGAAVVYGIYIPTMQFLQKHHPVPVTSAYGKIGSAVCFLLAASITKQFT